MTFDEFNEFCASLPATNHVVQWGGSDVWKVGTKMFAIGTMTKANVPGFTFKVSELDFELLPEQPAYRPAPYLASRGMKWIQQYDETGQETDDDELKILLKESHQIVSLGLTKKAQKELGLNEFASNIVESI